MAPSVAGLLGCGCMCDAAGAPLRAGGSAIIGTLVDHAGLRLGAGVLDVGCGAGESLAWLERHGYIGVGLDRDGDALALAAARTAAPLYHADAARLPFADARFDAVLSECSLSLMDDRRSALVEWRRVLTADGRLLLADVDWPSEDGGDGLGDDIAAAGFAIVHQEDRSDAFAGFVARFIFSHGSLDALWADGNQDQRARQRPRYRLVVARKRSEPWPPARSVTP